MKAPDLNGTWKGFIYSDFIHENTGEQLSPISTILTIHQTAESISCTMLTGEMKSYSDQEKLEHNAKTDEWKLTYDYQSTPKKEVIDRSPVHLGRMTFIYHAETRLVLAGSYYTNRKTKGEIELGFWKEEKLRKLPDEGESHPATEADLVIPACPTVLFIGVSPTDQVQIDISREYKSISKEVEKLIDDQKINLEISLASTPRDLHAALFKYRPNIIHFSGHGSEEGIFLENELGQSLASPNEGIIRLFNSFKDDLHCIILNSCWSESVAKELSQFVPFVIGMNDRVTDVSAKEFSIGFYLALANGADIPRAFEAGKVHIGFSGRPGSDIPILFERP